MKTTNPTDQIQRNNLSKKENNFPKSNSYRKTTIFTSKRIIEYRQISIGIASLFLTKPKRHNH
jgi:hypothetical protein